MALKKLILLTLLIQGAFLFAQKEVYVSAENGLIVRNKPNRKAERIGKFNHAEKLNLLQKTGKQIIVIDEGKTIKGEWYKVNSNNALTGYVFSGFLSNKKLKNSFEFISYNTDYDYFFLEVKNSKGNVETFIHNTEENIKYLRGDIIEIAWKEDSITMAGDESIVEKANILVSSKKIRGGNVSKFRKNYKKEISYLLDKDNYSTSFLEKIYLNIEYYTANTTNKLLRNLIINNKQITCTVAQIKRNDKPFLQIGITHLFEHKTNTVKWLYYNLNSSQFYEYDLPNDSLIEIK